MADLPREVDIFRKYSKNNKTITLIIAIAIAIAFVVGLYFFIKIVVPYTVTYSTNGGTVVPADKYKFLQKVSEPKTKVKKEGYYIEKWSTKKDLSNEFVFGTKLWRSMTLYVDWQPGVAVVLDFYSGEENEDLSVDDLKLLYEQYVKAGSTWTLPEVYNLNKDSLNYGERLVWFDEQGNRIVDETFENLTENVYIYGKWFDVKQEKFKVDENGVLQTYLGYAKNIILPNNIVAIKDIDPMYFISGTDQLHEQNSPNASAFRNVINKLESIYLNKSLQRVGDCAFNACIKLQTVEFLGNSIGYIGRNAFWKTSIKEIIIPDSVTSIENRAFFEAEKLKKITLGRNIEEVGAEAFRGCFDLEEVVLNSAPIIHKLAFSFCIGLEKFTINAEELATINLGITEAEIRQNYLQSNPSATSEEVEEEVLKQIRNNNIFLGIVGVIAPLEILVPADYVALYKDAFGWKTYTDYIKAI